MIVHKTLHDMFLRWLLPRCARRSLLQQDGLYLQQSGRYKFHSYSIFYFRDRMHLKAEERSSPFTTWTRPSSWTLVRFFAYFYYSIHIDVRKIYIYVIVYIIVYNNASIAKDYYWIGYAKDDAGKWNWEDAVGFFYFDWVQIGRMYLFSSVLEECHSFSPPTHGRTGTQQTASLAWTRFPSVPTLTGPRAICCGEYYNSMLYCLIINVFKYRVWLLLYNKKNKKKKINEENIHL